MTGPPKFVAAKMDLHVHSRYSSDGKGSVQDLVAMARKKGINGFIVSDHNTFAAAKEVAHARAADLLVIPGMEVTSLAGHCLAIGIREAVPSQLPLRDTLEAIERAGGVGVPSHPYRIFNGVGEKELRGAGRKLVAVEVFNARDGRGTWHNPRARKFATKWNLGGTGGSDTHQIFEIGNGYTMFPEAPENVDDVVDQIRKGKTWGGGKGTPKYQLIRQKGKNLRLWIKRGFKPM